MSVNKEESGIHIVRLDDQSGVDIAKAMVQTGLMKQGGILSKKGIVALFLLKPKIHYAPKQFCLDSLLD